MVLLSAASLRFRTSQTEASGHRAIELSPPMTILPLRTCHHLLLLRFCPLLLLFPRVASLELCTHVCVSVYECYADLGTMQSVHTEYVPQLRDHRFSTYHFFFQI